MKKASYTKEECQEEAKKFTNITAFKVQAGTIYNYAYRNGWLAEICSHMPPKKKWNGYWTKEMCIDEAKKYKTRVEFSEKSPGGYTVARRNKWLDECCKDMIEVGNRIMRAIYAFEFSDKHAYIGLSYNLDARKQQHLSEMDSPVYRHKQETSAQFEFKPLSDYVEIEEATKLEAAFIDEYKNNGWKLLNSIAAGALGGIIVIWTEERCWEEAMAYQTRDEFRKNSASAYNSALRNGWLNKICSHMTRVQNPPNFWDEESCLEEALQYKSRTEFHRNSGAAYIAARRLGILDKICLHMSRKESSRKWTLEKCLEEAKKYENKKEFREKSAGAYFTATKGGFLDLICRDMTSDRKPKSFWTLDECQREAKKYETRGEFQAKNVSAYRKALDEGWLDEICSHMIKTDKPKNYWTKDRCHDEAKRYETRGEFQAKNVSAYRKALDEGWLDEICSHMIKTDKPKNYWTKDRCHDEAKRYETRGEFQRESTVAYRKAANEEWLDEICSHMIAINKPKNYWTKDRCHDEAKRYETRGKFREESNAAYCKASSEGWLDEICTHMTNQRTPQAHWTKENIIAEAKKYKTRSEFNRKSGSAATVARGMGWYEEIWKLTHPEG